MSATIHIVGRQITRWLLAALLLSASIISPFTVVHAQTISPVHTQLTPAAVVGGSFGLHRITADGSRLVYLADQDTAGVVEIYSVPISGGTWQQMRHTEAHLRGGDLQCTDQRWHCRQTERGIGRGTRCFQFCHQPGWQSRCF